MVVERKEVKGCGEVEGDEGAEERGGGMAKHEPLEVVGGNEATRGESTSKDELEGAHAYVPGSKKVVMGQCMTAVGSKGGGE